MTDKESLDEDAEFAAMREVHDALKPLDELGRARVLEYVAKRLKIGGVGPPPITQELAPPDPTTEGPPSAQTSPDQEPNGTAPDGISAVALKWIKRTGLSAEELEPIFSIGLDEIDLIAQKIPGSNKRERAQNVFRLMGIAKYLATGAARVTHDELKEACIAYDAYDLGNHAATLRALGREISGTKESGYTLTPSGIASAATLIKGMIQKSG